MAWGLEVLGVEFRALGCRCKEGLWVDNAPG